MLMDENFESGMKIMHIEIITSLLRERSTIYNAQERMDEVRGRRLFVIPRPFFIFHV